MPVVHADGRTLTPQEVAMVAQQKATVAVSEDAWPGCGRAS